MRRRTVFASALAGAMLVCALSSEARAHGLVVGRSASGQLKAHVEVSLPVPLPPSPFPGTDGWAGASPGIASAEVDEPQQDLYMLAPNSSIQLILVGADAGIQIVTSHVWVVGEVFDMGPPVFDYHLVYNIPNGQIGATYAMHFRLHDVNGVHADSPVFTLVFTPVLAPCSCRGDLDDDVALTADDVQSFVACMTEHASGGPPDAHCACADMDANGALDGEDAHRFVHRLLDSDACP